MADQDELRLRIVPELDQQAKKQVEDDLSTISGNIPIGGRGKGGAGDPEATARKQRLSDIRAEIDLIDLRARKEGVASIKRVDSIRQEMALNRIALEEGGRLIALEEANRSQASQQAITDMNQELALAQQLNLTKSESASIQRKVFFATDRLENGFTTMSRSMTGLNSNTKDANIAFANFGRIIQDAPFGILGISNNIDPLLNSFAQLKNSTGGATNALKAMLSVMRGPLGLIFLFGSVLPSALVVAERAMMRKRKATREAKEEMADYGDLLRSAASSQLGGIIPSTMSYSEQVRVLRSSMEGLTNITVDQNQINGHLVRTQKSQLLTLEQLTLNVGQYNTAQASSTKLTVDNGVATAKLTDYTFEENQAVREIIQSKLNEARANQAIESALKRLGIQRQKSTEEIEAELKAQQDFDFYMARRGATQVVTGETPLMRVAREQREEQAKLRQEQADEAVRGALTVGEGELNVTRATLGAKLQLYRTSEDMVGEVMSSGARFRAQLLENEQQGLIDMMDLSVSLARTAFGDTKGVAIAEALVNTYVGVSRAFREYTPPLSGVIAGLQLANGIAQVNKIRSTKIGDKGGSASTSSASVSAPSSRSFVNDLGAAGQVAGTIGPFGASMTPNISITANLDRQGLALAVRDGEADIATRQIPFAS
jgi:hypothetical protein